jgi:hypothetical protein
VLPRPFIPYGIDAVPTSTSIVPLPATGHLPPKAVPSRRPRRRPARAGQLRQPATPPARPPNRTFRRHSTARHSTARHSTDRARTAQHSTDRARTAQHSTDRARSAQPARSPSSAEQTIPPSSAPHQSNRSGLSRTRSRTKPAPPRGLPTPPSPAIARNGDRPADDDDSRRLLSERGRTSQLRPRATMPAGDWAARQR